jgi:hypothetical protein
MRRRFRMTLAVATAVAAVGLSGCSGGESKESGGSESTGSSAAPATPGPAAAPPAAALPAPEALTDLLNRLADPGVPGIDKVPLIEGATPDNAATLDKFSNALRDNGYLPMTFTAANIAWSDKNPSNVTATVSINTPHPSPSGFTFPMEFAPFHNGWQLSRKTAEMLLALGNSSPLTTSPAPAPAPTPGSAPPPQPPR